MNKIDLDITANTISLGASAGSIDFTVDIAKDIKIDAAVGSGELPVQADWDESNPVAKSYIRNKPHIVKTVNGIAADAENNVDVARLDNSDIFAIFSR